MSTENLFQACHQVVDNPCGGIELLIQPKEKSLGDFSVRRVLPAAHKKLVGPWIFFDHMGPAEFKAGTGVNVRPHPHIGLATVTYLFEGEMLHRDSLGSMQVIQPGDINLMVAGSGIVHSERERPEVKDVDHRTHGLQLWLALPKEQEDIEPAFYHYPSKDIPLTKVDGVPVRIMMGQAYGKTSPVKTFADTLYIEATLADGQTLMAPDSEERAVYVANGAIEIDKKIVPEYSMAVLTRGREINIQAIEQSKIAIVGGKDVGDRYIYWNFVSSEKQKIESAKKKWREGGFAKVPEDEVEFIPLPEK